MIAFVILFTANLWNTKHANCKLSSTIVGRWSQIISSCRIIVELFSISWLYIQFVISSKFIKKAFRMANGSSGGVISTLSKLVHLIAVVHFYYGLYYDMRYVFPPESHPLFHKISSWGGKFRYLTILGAVCIWLLIHSSREKISIFHNLINFLIVFYRFGKHSTLHFVFLTISLEPMNTIQNGHQNYASSRTMCSPHLLSHWLWLLPFHSGQFMLSTVNWSYQKQWNPSSQGI